LWHSKISVAMVSYPRDKITKD